MRAKSPPPSRPRPKRGRAAAPPGRSPGADRKLIGLAILVVVTATGLVYYLIRPDAARHQCYQVMALCVIVAAAAGRALMGYREPEAEPSLARWVERLSLAAIFLAAVLPYLPSLGVGFLSDDYGLSAAVARMEGPIRAVTVHPLGLFFRPLFVLAWWIQYHVWGDSPIGYHAFSLLCHAANALLVFLLGRRLTGSLPAALIAALLFAVHPLHSEAVVWVCCQADLLAAGFALLSLLSLDIFLTSSQPRLRYLSLAAGLIAFFLALAAKESALALPGVAALWALVRADRARVRWAVLVGAGYGVVLNGYFLLRFQALGALGGYHTRADFWNAVFPSAPLRQLAAFFFPFNRPLLGDACWVLPTLVILSTAFLWWCVRDLCGLPGRRLGLYLGFLLLAAIPVWSLGPPGADLEGARVAYLPTLGIIWLIGDLCAARGLARRRTVGVIAAALVLAGALCVWYLTPWLGARRVADETLAAGVRMVEEAPPTVVEPTFFLQSLPDTYSGAQIFRNCFPVALNQKLGRKVLVRTVGIRGDLPPETMALAPLQPGEFLYEWDAKRKRMNLLRQGGPPR